MYRTIFPCLDCGKPLPYRGKRAQGKRCRSCTARWLTLNNPRFLKNGFKKGNKYGKRFKKGQKATEGSFKKGHDVPFDIRWKIHLASVGQRRSPATEFKPTGRAQEYKRSKHITDHRYDIWRKAVYHRDKWICQKCGQRGGKLQAHHKKSWVDYPELRYSLKNGLTLCLECHKQVHRRLK